MTAPAFKLTDLFDIPMNKAYLPELQKWGQAARNIARGSADNTKVGCIILDKQFNPLATGCNNFAAGLDVPDRLMKNRDWKINNITMAEEGALHAMMRNGIPMQNRLLITTHYPSVREAMLIGACGIKDVFVDHAGFTDRFLNNWSAAIVEGQQIMAAQGITVSGLAIPLTDKIVDRLPIPQGEYRTGYAINELPTLTK
tara:strand:+ start:211563 stop:212159 length:597 start_codon:yes stop_codon:yes gene_type:complete